MKLRIDFGASPLRLHARDQVGDVVGVDPVERAVAEERHQMRARLRFDVLDGSTACEPCRRGPGASR